MLRLNLPGFGARLVVVVDGLDARLPRMERCHFYHVRFSPEIRQSLVGDFKLNIQQNAYRHLNDIGTSGRRSQAHTFRLKIRILIPRPF